jgi:hypothetical protein
MQSAYVRAILWGLVAGFVVGVLIGFVYHDAPGSRMPLYCGAFAGVLTAYLKANLAGNRKIAAASDADKHAALTRTPPPGKALLFLYRTGFVAKLAGMNIGVDGKIVAQLKAPRFTCVVVSAGKHTLKASFGGLAGPQTRVAEAEVATPADRIVVVRFTVGLGVVQNRPDIVVMPAGADSLIPLQGMAMIPPDAAEV